MYEYMVPVLYRYLAHARLRLSRLVVSTLELIGGSGRTGHRRPLRVCKRVCCARLHLGLHFADRLRAGAGRRSGSGRRPGRVRWGRPLLSRPRGAFGSVAAAVESAADSVIARSCGRAGVLVGLDGCEVLLCDPCARVRPCVPCVCPGSPRCLFTGTRYRYTGISHERTQRVLRHDASRNRRASASRPI